MAKLNTASTMRWEEALANKISSHQKSLSRRAPHHDCKTSSANRPQLADYVTSHHNADVRDMLELIRDDPVTLAEVSNISLW